MSHPVDILLVEDDPNDRELALHAFRRHNLANSVQVVSDGAEALDFLFGAEGEPPLGPTEQPRLVLLDLKLPKVDGLAVLRAIRSNAASRLTPVVVMTSSDLERDVVESYELGVNAYIVKPLDFGKFVETAKAIGFFWLLLNTTVSRLP